MLEKIFRELRKEYDLLGRKYYRERTARRKLFALLQDMQEENERLEGKLFEFACEMNFLKSKLSVLEQMP